MPENPRSYLYDAENVYEQIAAVGVWDYGRTRPAQEPMSWW